MLSVKYVFLIWQETNGGIVILKTVLKSDVWPGSEKCGFNPKLEDNDLKLGCYRVPKLPPLSVKHICPISHKTNPPIMIPKIVLKSVLWRCSESAQYFCIFQLLCFSLHPTAHICTLHIQQELNKQQTKSHDELYHSDSAALRRAPSSYCMEHNMLIVGLFQSGGLQVVHFQSHFFMLHCNLKSSSGCPSNLLNS